jgi:ornithine cyclodeaminase
MVDYIGVSDIQRIVQALGTANFIERLAHEIEADYRRWAEFEKSARLASHSPVGVIELMPATDGSLYSFKYVNGHPKNTARGLLTVTAFGVLAAVDTGYPLLLSELTVTTALRTAATSALAAKWMARHDSRVMALIGNGAQSEFQALAFHRLVGIRELHLYDVDPRATAKLERNLAGMPELADLNVIRAKSVSDACRGADIVTTVTADKRNAVILTPPMIAPGMHLNGVGGDCPGKTELHPDILRMPGARVVVEYEPQSRIEGEIQQMGPDFPVIELAQVVRGEVRARTAATDVTIFDSVGFALEDYSALRFLHSLVSEQQVGRRQIDLVPELADPKDLFGGTLGSPAAVRRARTSRRTA